MYPTNDNLDCAVCICDKVCLEVEMTEIFDEEIYDYILCCSSCIIVYTHNDCKNDNKNILPRQ
jgi:hypothetical protein